NSFRTAFASLFWRLTKHAEKALRIVKLQHPEKHEDTGQAEAPMPTNLLADIATKQHSQECSHIDTHIENGISRVYLLAIIRVQLAYNRRDIRFEQPVTQDDQRQAYVEKHLSYHLQGHRRVT